MSTDLDTVIERIAKEYGAETIHFGDKTEEVKRIPTGSLELDIITMGGIPIGRWTRLWGGYMSGKSLLAWNVIRNAQSMGLSTAYYNIEKQYDANYVKALGIDVDKMLVVEGTIIEEIGTKLDALLRAVNVHVLDSCTAAVSVDELNAKLEDWRPGLSARAWGKVFRRAEEAFDTAQNTIILIDQARDAFGSYKGGEQAPGGRAMEHVSSLTMRFRRGSWLFRTKEGFLTSADSEAAKKEHQGLSGDKEPDGQEVQIHVTKSRVSPPYRSARIMYDYSRKKFDWGSEYAKAAIYFDVVEQKGAWFTLPDGNKVQGEMGLRKALVESKELRDTVRKVALGSR